MGFHQSSRAPLPRGLLQHFAFCAEMFGSLSMEPTPSGASVLCSALLLERGHSAG